MLAKAPLIFRNLFHEVIKLEYSNHTSKAYNELKFNKANFEMIHKQRL